MTAEQQVDEQTRVFQAAARLRELAGAATAPPWWVHDGCVEDLWWGDQAATRKVDAGECCEKPNLDNCTGECEVLLDKAGQLAHGQMRNGEDAALIALQDPAYALAVAVLLEAVAMPNAAVSTSATSRIADLILGVS